jgi:hypothetical protein
MLKFFLTVTPLLIADLWWWREADRRLRRIGRGYFWRSLLSVFMAAQVAYLLWLILGEFVEDLGDWRPLWLPMGAYIWHVLLLPAGCFWFIASAAWNKVRAKRAKRRSAVAQLESGAARWSRRELLSAAAVAAPPLVTVFATRQAIAQMGEFRIREIELAIPQLPADLDGLSIAHVTDLHIGRFMPARLTGAMADATNALDCDLIAFTGDLIDASQRTVSPGIQFMRRLRPRYGMVMIEGNHDVVRNAGRFEAEVRDAGLPLLLDETMTFSVPGRTTPVQFLGTTWGELKSGRELHRAGKERDYWFREYSNEARDASVRRVAAMREPGAFPILLAHHPHAFDAAAAAGFPLILSGHTHGGQIMLTHNIGAGPLRFRYWSGLYRKPGSQMFISNGIGSWFPLRVNAPSEIVRITLKRVLIAG